ncbi:hypothetical protein CHISP_2498 [Chitinispirillum alkaliphilum]|nr:hypothetical protein CHISP_2498 [Chitinispirillum alkaliphilum]
METDMSNNNQPHALLLLAHNEEQIGKLYEHYATCITHHRDFWKKHSTEEFKHAKWIHSLIELVNKGIIDWDTKRFNEAAIRTMNSYVIELTEKAQKRCPTTVEAISDAMSIETALIERKFFEAFESDNKQFSDVISSIREETQKHLDEIKHLWNNYHNR